MEGEARSRSPGITGVESWRSLPSGGPSKGPKDQGNVPEGQNPLLEAKPVADCYEWVRDRVGQAVWSGGRVCFRGSGGRLAMDLGREKRPGMNHFARCERLL